MISLQISPVPYTYEGFQMFPGIVVVRWMTQLTKLPLSGEDLTLFLLDKLPEVKNKLDFDGLEENHPAKYQHQGF